LEQNKRIVLHRLLGPRRFTSVSCACTALHQLSWTVRTVDENFRYVFLLLELKKFEVESCRLLTRQVLSLAKDNTHPKEERSNL
jgi:hypothetical protein